MFQKPGAEFFKDGNRAVLRILRLFQVFEAHTINQVHIALKKFSNNIQVMRLLVCSNQFVIRFVG